MNAMGHGVDQLPKGNSLLVLAFRVPRGSIRLPTGGKYQGCWVPRHELDHEGLEFRVEGEPQWW